jgi:hypothetical protein
MTRNDHGRARAGQATPAGQKIVPTDDRVAAPATIAETVAVRPPLTDLAIPATATALELARGSDHLKPWSRVMPITAPTFMVTTQGSGEEVIISAAPAPVPHDATARAVDGPLSGVTPAVAATATPGSQSAVVTSAAVAPSRTRA